MSKVEGLEIKGQATQTKVKAMRAQVAAQATQAKKVKATMEQRDKDILNLTAKVEDLVGVVAMGTKGRKVAKIRAEMEAIRAEIANKV